MKKNVVFIKVQKCSSTSVKNLMDEYASNNKLKLLLMKKVRRPNGSMGPSPAGWRPSFIILRKKI